MVGWKLFIRTGRQARYFYLFLCTKSPCHFHTENISTGFSELQYAKYHRKWVQLQFLLFTCLPSVTLFYWCSTVLITTAQKAYIWRLFYYFYCYLLSFYAILLHFCVKNHRVLLVFLFSCILTLPGTATCLFYIKLNNVQTFWDLITMNVVNMTLTHMCADEQSDSHHTAWKDTS